ncbi:MAG: hypothetical protein LBU05_06845, partial [Bifidobacteriaceae bacterium]|nr:hypothetical protein [Bifidobacteriaceae bacterium]
MTTASGVPEGIFLFIPPLYDFILSAICLAVIAYVIVRKVVPTYLKVLDDRTEKIEGGIARAAEAQELIAQERARSAEELAQARHEAGRARDEARQDAAAILTEARRKASEEAERILEAARAQIAADTRA